VFEELSATPTDSHQGKVRCCIIYELPDGVVSSYFPLEALPETTLSTRTAPGAYANRSFVAVLRGVSIHAKCPSYCP
jgi:hypothetical protein